MMLNLKIHSIMTLLTYLINFQDKHWLLRMPPSPLPDSMLPDLDRVYRQRWETLLSVDDLVESIVVKLDSLGLLDNTYLILTSDHGYHVGKKCILLYICQ
jgi:N-acetylglucosamine-6-sulfatase